MIDIEQISPTAHRMVVIGAFYSADAKRMIDFANESIEAGNSRNLLIDLTALTDFSIAAVSEELVHIPTLLKWLYSLDRIAIISDEKWIRSAARLESALLPGVVYEVYDEDEAEAARAWVSERIESPHNGALRELDIGNPKIAAFELLGRLDREESERGVDIVRKRLAETDCSLLMLVIKNWHGFDAEVLFSRKVLSSKLELISDLERYAIVGGPDWIGNLAGSANALLKFEIRAFDLGQQEEAIKWLAS